MRISELARKYSVTPTEIVKYLEEKGKKIGSYNARLEKDLVELLEARFGNNEIQPEKQENTSSDEKLTNNLQDPEEPETHKAKPAASGITEPDNADEEILFEPEKIDIPKPRLPGIRVVGKIDLPEKPGKDEIQSSTDDQNQTEKEVDITPNEEKKHSKSKKKSGKGKQRKSEPQRELTYKEKLNLEHRRKARKKSIEKRKEKEKKRRHYETRVQSKLPKPSPKTKKKSGINEYNEPVIREKPQYKNPLRILWAWLNGEYDDRY